MGFKREIFILSSNTSGKSDAVTWEDCDVKNHKLSFYLSLLIAIKLELLRVL
jgi:hypothetical protein